jgi:hypothetical protein
MATRNLPGSEDQAAAATATLPPPARLIYRAIWNPRYHRTERW